MGIISKFGGLSCYLVFRLGILPFGLFTGIFIVFQKLP